MPAREASDTRKVNASISSDARSSPAGGQQSGHARPDDLRALIGRFQPRVRRDQAGTGKHIPHGNGQRGIGEHGHHTGRESQTQDQPR